MSGDRAAALAAARRHVQETAPALLSWSRKRWAAWIDRQRDTGIARSATRIFVMASITCLEDLWLQFGLMQGLALPGVNCTVLLGLPTDDAVRLVRSQARRQAWDGFVRILRDEQLESLLNDLPDTAVVAVFSGPSILPADVITLVADTLAQGEPTALRNAATIHENAFVGSAGRYRSLSTQVLTTSARPAAQALCQLIDGGKFEHLGEATKLPELLRQKDADRVSMLGTIDGTGGWINLPSLAADGECCVSTIDAAGTESTFLRLTGEVDSEFPVRVRVSSELLTVEPRSIRVRCTADKASASEDFLLHVPPSNLRPWMLAAFLNRGGGGNPVIRAFVEGVGCRIGYAEDEPDELREIPVVWGVLRDSDRILAQACAQAMYFFYIDHAYFDRGHGKSYRITRNAYECGAIRRCPDDRANALGVTLEPWRKSGREVIVCPPTEYFMKAHGCPDWLESTLAELAKVTDRRIVIREKPKPGETAVALLDALKTAHALVTHSSNIAIEAACLGTPVFVAPTSAAAPVGRTELSALEAPDYPDREPWLAHLAYNQFSIDEIRDGRAWRLLLELEGRELV